jgi:putative MFS transporter
MSEASSSSSALGNKVRMTYTEFLDKSPMTPSLWLLLVGLCLAQLLDGMDFMVTSFALPGIIKEFKINPAMAGAIPSIGNIGLALGAIFFPLLADRVGRKPIFQWVLLTFAFGSFLSAIAPSYKFMLVARFITGVGLGAEIPIVFAVLAEYAPSRLRHVLIPLAPIFFAVGWIVAALLSIWIIPAFGWRGIFWVGIVPALLISYIRRYVPESVRFLLSRGKVEEAGRIMQEMARTAGMGNVELVVPTLAKNQTALSFGEQLGLLRPVLGATLVLVLFYFCSFIQTFAINAWLPTIFVRQGFLLAKSFNYTLIIFMVVPVSQCLAIWLMPRMRRKTALLLMTTLATIFFFLFGLSLEHRWSVPVMVGSQVLQTLWSQGIVSILFTLSSEIFPTPVRSLGLGLVSGVGRFGAVVGPFILGVSLHWGARISQVIYVFATPLFIAAILAFLVIRVDTRDKGLEEIGSGAGQAKPAHAGH